MATQRPPSLSGVRRERILRGDMPCGAESWGPQEMTVEWGWAGNHQLEGRNWPSEKGQQRHLSFGFLNGSILAGAQYGRGFRVLGMNLGTPKGTRSGIVYLVIPFLLPVSNQPCFFPLAHRTSQSPTSFSVRGLRIGAAGCQHMAFLSDLVVLGGHINHGPRGAWFPIFVEPPCGWLRTPFRTTVQKPRRFSDSSLQGKYPTNSLVSPMVSFRGARSGFCNHSFDGQTYGSPVKPGANSKKGQSIRSYDLPICPFCFPMSL